MKEKMDFRVALAGFTALAAVIGLELLLIFREAPPMQPWISPAAKVITRIMFGH
ncbi:MAG TPA: hypothetical protein VFA22_02655 [Stellaceae bacterium]|nr:hypothetical protein [Stellaceae bacterium]